MTRLTGFQRYQITRAWLKNGRQGDKEDYVRKVCQAKGIEYTPPIDIEEARKISPKANMFPGGVKNNAQDQEPAYAPAGVPDIP